MKWFKPALVLTLGFGLFLILQLSFRHPFHSLPFEKQKIHVSRAIIATFKKDLGKLNAEKRGHFLVRLYRLSEDEKYLPGIWVYAERIVSQFKIHAQNLNSPEYIQRTAEHFLKLPEKPLLKHRYRAKYRSTWPEIAFAHRLLFLAFQIKSFGLDQGPLQPDFDKVLQYLRGLAYRDYVLDDNIIRYNSTRAVNMIYQLKFLGLGDYEKVFTEKFKNIFFSQPDKALDPTVYLNKIYGLTHLVIAASDFYQHPVSTEKFNWVLDYFEQNLETILIRSTPDMAAEIAVCFKLASEENHPAVERVQRYLLDKFDPKRGYLPSDRKESTLDDIEHRNIMGMMALANWQELYTGPDLHKTKN